MARPLGYHKASHDYLVILCLRRNQEEGHDALIVEFDLLTIDFLTSLTSRSNLLDLSYRMRLDLCWIVGSSY